MFSLLRPALIALLLSPAAAWAGAPLIETVARHAILIDDTTGDVLLDKDSDARMPPASMSKLMTAYVVFERLKAGRLTLDTALPVSERAWKMGGSKMFVMVKSSVKVQDLLRGVIIQSGNDACVVLAEGLSGTEEAFAGELNATARQLGLTGSRFANSTGWPDPDHYTTARDLATLARAIIHDHPDFYPIYSEKEFVYHNIKQGNRNPLLYTSIGGDGLKTGHTEEAGYGLTGSAVQNGRRLIMVLGGLKNMNERARESERVMTLGFKVFENYRFFEAGAVVDEAKVWLGTADSVQLYTDDEIILTLPRAARPNTKVKLVYTGPVHAPIRAGQPIAELVIEVPDREPRRFPLKAKAEVERIGAIARLSRTLNFLLLGIEAN